MTTEQQPVRPTKRCLNDLGLSFPSLDVELHTMKHPIVSKSQKVPALAVAHQAQRVDCTSDRLWWKVKIGDERAAVTELIATDEPHETLVAADAMWWVGAAGPRRDGDPSDFYVALAQEVTRHGKGTGGPSSVHLLPQPIDEKRLRLERLAVFEGAIRGIVRTAIARAVATGKMHNATITLDDRQPHEIGAAVYAPDGEAYLVITTRNWLDHRVIAIILAAVPGVAADDWLPEPEGHFNVTPGHGQIVYSAIIPAETQSALVAAYH